MPNISYSYTLTNGTTADASQVQANFDTAKAAINGGLDGANLTAVTAANLGLTRGATSSRGKSIVGTSESRTNTAYGLLATPDKVTVALPADGLIFVAYQATWQESVSGAGRAAICLNGTQQMVAAPAATAGTSTAVTVAAATTGATAGTDHALASSSVGLISASTGLAYTGDVTTGQSVGLAPYSPSGTIGCELGTSVFSLPAGVGAGGHCEIFAAAGTYDVSIQFKASSGSVSAKNRRLWVWTVGFD